MPEINRLFGVIVTMYFGDHEPPHFHVRYGSRRARFAIGDLELENRRLARAQEPLQAIAA